LGVFEIWTGRGAGLGKETKAQATDETTAAAHPQKAQITF